MLTASSFRRLLHLTVVMFVSGVLPVLSRAEVNLVGLKLKADSGDAHSQFVVGMLYEAGTQGVTKSLSEAVKYYRLSATSGYAQGQNALAKCYLRGIGVARSDSDGVHWLSLAAEQGLDQAEYELGQLKLSGKLVPRDTAGAVTLFQKSAGEQEPRSALALALLYQAGKAVPRDTARYIHYLTVAANAPIIHAQLLLAAAYASGNGVAKSDTQAVHWYRFAASLGDATAMTILGSYYEKGLMGCSVDTMQAFTWYASAAKKGYRLANQSLVNLSRNMSPSQIEAARRRPLEESNAADTSSAKQTVTESRQNPK